MDLPGDVRPLVQRDRPRPFVPGPVDLRGEFVVLPADEPEEQRHRDHRRAGQQPRHVVVDGQLPDAVRDGEPEAERARLPAGPPVRGAEGGDRDEDDGRRVRRDQGERDPGDPGEQQPGQAGADGTGRLALSRVAADAGPDGPT